MKLPDLPLNYWGAETLSKIASRLGKPLFADACTAKQKRLSYARVLVEMNITQNLPKEVEIVDPAGRTFVQNIKYDWKPLFCKKCTRFGHTCSVDEGRNIQPPNRRGQAERVSPRQGRRNQVQKWIPRPGKNNDTCLPPHIDGTDDMNKHDQNKEPHKAMSI